MTQTYKLDNILNNTTDEQWQDLKRILFDRVPVGDDYMGEDQNDLHRRAIIETEPGESIEVKYITDHTGIMPPDAI